MPTTKLTLSIDKDVINKAKAYAHKSGKSLSALVESYLQAITGASKTKDESGNIVKLKGILSHLDEGKDYKIMMAEAREEKYGKK